MRKPYTKKRPPLDPCPLEEVLSLVGGKWKARILYALGQGPASFSRLKASLGRVSREVLSTQLRALMSDGLITAAPDEGGTGALYLITTDGAALVALLVPVAAWGEQRLERRCLPR
jgi:DNA-binding HxlR family transcriptional regulator